MRPFTEQVGVATRLSSQRGGAGYLSGLSACVFVALLVIELALLAVRGLLWLARGGAPRWLGLIAVLVSFGGDPSSPLTAVAIGAAVTLIMHVGFRDRNRLARKS
jgi:hypothetical protein